MCYKILIIPLLLIATHARAQNFVQVQQLQGNAITGNTHVNVEAIDRPSFCNYNNVMPYHIGNKRRTNGYRFSFEKPVQKVLLHFSGINDNEQIEIDINGEKYQLSQANISKYKSNLTATTENGLLTIKGTAVMADATVYIAPGYDIRTVYVHHLNALLDGCVFDLFIEDYSYGKTEPESSTGIGNNATTKLFELYPNPTTGSFTVKANTTTNNTVNLKIVNLAGQTLYEKNVAPVDQFIHEKINLNETFPNGLYTLYLDNVQNIQFSLRR